MSVGHQGKVGSKVLTKRNGTVNEEAYLLSGDKNAKKQCIYITWHTARHIISDPES